MATAGENFEVWGCLKVIFPSENTLFERVSTTEHPQNLKKFRPSAVFFLNLHQKSLVGRSLVKLQLVTGEWVGDAEPNRLCGRP